MHISTQRVSQLAEIAQWLRDRGVPAEAATGLDDWERTGTVLVTSGLLPADLAGESRAICLDGDDWATVLAEIPRRLASHQTYMATQTANRPTRGAGSQLPWPEATGRAVTLDNGEPHDHHVPYTGLCDES
ncbi:hypothetical protein [Streptomyces sp. NPDC059816]|uniref:hypothetical protein n=1 Tax=Streptomyces sp. NPDC059816 TaxID=3346960 RepID=UPI003650E166